MKQRHAEAKRLIARTMLADLAIDVGQDFHTLKASQVDALLAEADRLKYQKPAQANGSRARYFHDLLQRHAQIKV